MAIFNSYVSHCQRVHESLDSTFLGWDHGFNPANLAKGSSGNRWGLGCQVLRESLVLDSGGCCWHVLFKKEDRSGRDGMSLVNIYPEVGYITHETHGESLRNELWMTSMWISWKVWPKKSHFWDIFITISSILEVPNFDHSQNRMWKKFLDRNKQQMMPTFLRDCASI